MDQETKNIIKEQIESLPPELRALVADPTVGEKVIGIGKKNGLGDEQLGKFQLETTLLMIGLINPDEFGKELSTQLNINQLKIDNLVNDINREILQGHIDILKDLYQETDEESDKEDTVSEDEKEITDTVDLIISGGKK